MKAIFLTASLLLILSSCAQKSGNVGPKPVDENSDMDQITASLISKCSNWEDLEINADSIVNVVTEMGENMKGSPLSTFDNVDFKLENIFENETECWADGSAIYMAVFHAEGCAKIDCDIRDIVEHDKVMACICVIANLHKEQMDDLQTGNVYRIKGKVKDWHERCYSHPEGNDLCQPQFGYIALGSYWLDDDLEIERVEK